MSAAFTTAARPFVTPDRHRRWRRIRWGQAILCNKARPLRSLLVPSTVVISCQSSRCTRCPPHPHPNNFHFDATFSCRKHAPCVGSYSKGKQNFGMGATPTPLAVQCSAVQSRPSVRPSVHDSAATTNDIPFTFDCAAKRTNERKQQRRQQRRQQISLYDNDA